MPSEVFSVKVSEELRERIRALMDGSGLQGKDFMEEVLKSYELNAIKDIAPSSAGDIEELQALTKRMYGLYVSLVERNSTLMKDRETSLQQEIETKNRAVSLIQGKLDAALAELETLKTEKGTIATLKEEVEQLQKRTKQLEAEKGDIQKQHSLDLQQAQLEKEKALLELREKLKEENEHLQKREKELEAEKTSFQNQHNIDLQQAQLEKEKALLELREKHQSQLEQIRAEYNERVKALLPPQQRG